MKSAESVQHACEVVGVPDQAKPPGEPEQLFDVIVAEIAQPASAATKALARELCARYGKAVQAILFYGSCFRGGDEDSGILDLYVVVDSYAGVYSSRKLALLNALLPPNVFYLEVPLDGRVIRTKYAVISLADFSYGTSERCFQAYFWGRFAQPCGLVYARDSKAVASVAHALAEAVRTFMTRSIPQLAPIFEAEALWKWGLAESYRTELRPEASEAVLRLVEAAPERYRRVTAAAIFGLAFPVGMCHDGEGLRYLAQVPSQVRWRSRQAWRLRRVQGKLLNIVRLMKAVFTFDGAVDYVLWKIERHSGIRIEATPRLRRHPLLAAWGIAWRLYRRGAFR